jgi:PAS domain-containing protein
MVAQTEAGTKLILRGRTPLLQNYISMMAHAHAELKDAKYVVFVDTSRRYVDCSDGVYELLGYSREEMLEKRIEDISYDVGEVPRLFAQYVKAGALEGEYVLQREDRTPLPIRYQAFVFSDGCHAAVWEPVQGWKEPYLAALLESDPGKQRAKIEHALSAMQDRLDASPEEQRRMNDALSMLNALRKAAG